MKIIKKSVLLLALAALSTQSFAFRIYNKTNAILRVFEEQHDNEFSFKTTLLPNESAACDPKSSDCRGKLAFRVNVGRVTAYDAECYWSGKIGSDRGNYFIISSVPGKAIGTKDWCRIEYGHA